MDLRVCPPDLYMLESELRRAVEHDTVGVLRVQEPPKGVMSSYN
jgi:hypothetical protein